MAVGQAVVDVEGQLDLAVPVGQPQVRQRRGLVEQQRRRLVVAVQLHHVETLVHQIVENDLPPAVG